MAPEPERPAARPAFLLATSTGSPGVNDEKDKRTSWCPSRLLVVRWLAVRERCAEHVGGEVGFDDLVGYLG